MATKKPTGLTASRNGAKFTFEWKIADKNYDAGVNVKLTNKRRVIVKGPVPGKSTSYSRNLDLNESFPGVTFMVQGKKKATDDYDGDSMSAWSSKSWDVKLPSEPSVKYAIDSEHKDAGTFSWSVTANNAWWSIYTGYEWQATLVSKSPSTQPTKWTSGYHGTGTATSGSWYRQEEDFILYDPDYSHTRWFRIRSKGPKGYSAWKVIHHTYAQPRPAIIKNAELRPKGTDNGYMCSVSWSSPWNFMYPIEDCTVEYVITAPETSTEIDPDTDTKKVSWKCPSSVNWTTVGKVNGASERHAYSFPIEDNLLNDEVVFVRILNNHDSHSIPSSEYLVTTGSPKVLPDPTGSFGTPVPQTHRVSLELTNASSIPDSFVAVYYRTVDQPATEDSKIIAIVPHNKSAVTIQCPDWGESTPVFGLRAFLADYTPSETEGLALREYTINSETIKMQSKSIIWETGKISLAPQFELSSPNSSTIRVVWDWPWDAANKTELTWADHEDAWESTEQPSSYVVDNIHAGQWNIANLNAGTYYVRVRLLKEDDEGTTYGMWSEIKSIKLSSAPAIPSLDLSASVITPDGEVTGYWGYVSTDGTAQMQADICEAVLDPETNTFIYGTPFVSTETAQHITISASEHQWLAGETHYLAVRVISASGEQSQGWSVPVAIEIASALHADILSTSLVEKTIETSDGDTITELCLTELPFIIDVSGATANGTTTISIIRSGYYLMDRPDGSEIDGFDGETIFSGTFNGEGQFELRHDDFVGYLDDAGAYQLIVSVKDAYGQVDEADPIDFKVRWEHQAIVPFGTVDIDTRYDVAILTPIIPSGVEIEEGDVCDIYRLSIDKPELIYEGAEFGSRYVDPYPTIGDNGGYRFVYRTFNGDYTTEDGRIAWYDTIDDSNNDILEAFGVMINFGEERMTLPYNVTLSNKWSKDFQTTNYLGGHIQGDWNPAVSRTGTISTVGIVYDEYATDEDMNVIDAVRRLATYSGVCHVRTPDGSSFAANINVSEDRENKRINQLANYSLEITRVDSESLDGLSYEDWVAEIGE